MKNKILIKIDSSERVISGGSSILGPVYQNWAYLSRAPTDLAVDTINIRFYNTNFEECFLSSFDLEDWDKPALLIKSKSWQLDLTALQCLDIKKRSHNLALERGEIIEFKLSEKVTIKDLGYLEVLLFCDVKKTEEG